jgi:phosphoribosylglycinamide formyltransferase-1
VQTRKRVAVFASGSGSNFAETFGIPALAVRPKDYDSREAYEADIVRALHEREIDFVVLAGYMRLITPVLLYAFADRILNIHPSLLPAFPGLQAVEQALDYGAKVVGVTVHFVDGGMDSGPIIAQEAIPVLPTDTAESLYARVQTIEHRLYPAVVRAFAEDRIRLDGRRVQLV